MYTKIPIIGGIYNLGAKIVVLLLRVLRVLIKSSLNKHVNRYTTILVTYLFTGYVYVSSYP